ncbi:outer membrane lipid asymmetry maintenance protein MlaD [Magnetovibrio sp. PR-2]|uniref:outer membrane lipid asymmetry maintenance protein MlaD n=1 Tax=Magnetovibrio sp. PR-2 TaxID=3120356 RepID=UPI002FCE3C0D
MGRNAIETVLGAAVLVVAVMFVYFATTTAQLKGVEGYEITARFFKVGGLTKGSDVRVSGIKIGTVTSNTLDPVTFDAVVSMSIRPDIQLPADTAATIASSGMLGDKYVMLIPGEAAQTMAPGDVIADTKDFRSLEDQVGEIIFLATGGDGN